jgi:uncharacterized repeat protein (TIGR01451 family)
MSPAKVLLPVSAAVLLLAVSAIVGARTIPEIEPAPAPELTRPGDGSLFPTDGVTPTVYLPLAPKNFDPETWLAPDHVFIADHPRITQLYLDGEGMAYFLHNNVERDIDHFSLTCTARAEAGAVDGAGIETDPPGLFDLSQIEDSDTVTCTFTLTDVITTGERVQLRCLYEEDPGSLVATAEVISPEPFSLADTNYNQMNDLLEGMAAQGGTSEPVDVIVALDHPATFADLETFMNTGGISPTVFEGEGFASFAGRIPATNLQTYAGAAEGLVFIDPDVEVAQTLDVATANTRAANVWTGALGGNNNPDADLAYEGDNHTSIAYADTGYDDSHPGLGAAKLTEWRDFNPAGAGAAVDTDGHGSHVAGILAGAVNAANPSGVAREAHLVAARATGRVSRSIQALRWFRARRQASRIVAISSSQGVGGKNIAAWDREMQLAFQDGIPVAQAAGNDFDEFETYGLAIATPGISPYVITVGSVNDQDQISFFSSQGHPQLAEFGLIKPDVVAPGGTYPAVRVAIRNLRMVGADQVGTRLGRDLLPNGQAISSVDSNDRTEVPGDLAPGANNYIEMAGTSMAAPHVAGELALMVDAITEYAAEDADNEGGADEDPWNGVDDDDDNIIDEDFGEFNEIRGGQQPRPDRQNNARLLKSVVLMTTFETTAGETVPRWSLGELSDIINDVDGDGQKDAGEPVLSSYCRSAADVVWDVDTDNSYDQGDDVLLDTGGGWAPGTANGAALVAVASAVGTDVTALFPNAGTPNSPPAVSRGGKDTVEGFGRVAVDAAIETLTIPFCGMDKDTFGAGLTDKKVWARHLHLYQGKEYKAILEVPGGGDFDLYIYYGNVRPAAGAGTGLARNWSFGEPVILARSTSAGMGADEEIEFTVPQDGTYFMVVKRVAGGGEFTVRLITPEEWTVMVYMPGELEGDSDLDDLLFEALNDMEEIGSGEEDMKEFQVLALADYDERAYDGKDGPPPAGEPDHRGDAVLYCVRRDHRDDQTQFSIAKQPADVLTLANAGQPSQQADADMGDPETLKKFAEWAVDYFPAKKYAVILWGDGRGYGWKTNPEKALGPGNDNKRNPGDAPDANKDALTMQELRDALKEVKSKINTGSEYKDDTGVDGYIPLVGFDMGHTGLLEVGRQIQESTETMVASEERIHDRGWPYKEILAALTDNAETWNAEDFGKEIVALYDTYYTITETDNIHTLSAVRLNPAAGAGDNKFDELVNETSSFAGEMLSVLSEPDRGTCEDEHDKVSDNVQYHIKHSARESVQEFEDKNYIDLQHFATLIKNSPICPGDITRDEQVIQLTQKGGPVILAEEHGPGRPNAHGLSIYFPHDQLLPEDANCKDAPDKGTRLCGFDSPLPSKVVYAKDANILVPGLRQGAASDTHPRPQEDLRLPGDTTWDEFLHRYYKPVADACVRAGAKCLKVVAGLVGTEWTLSGAGSSDSDGPSKDDVPVDWYWDEDPTKDIPAPMPAYPIPANAPVDPACTEDCDRDAADEPDDDPDLVGQVVKWVCPTPGIFPFRLMTHDEHNDQNRVHDEEAHFVHWKLHDDTLLIICFEPIIIKTPDTVTPGPGDDVGYDVTVTNNYPDIDGPDMAVTERVKEFHATDKLPSAMALQPDSLVCEGECSYDAAAGEIVWTGSLASGESADMAYSVVIDDSIEITDTTPVTLENTITTTLNGYVETATAVVTVTKETCTPLTGVTVVGDATVVAGDPLTVTSAYEPADASQPITYDWSPDWLMGGQGTPTATYKFLEPGPFTVGLEAANCDGLGVASADLDVMVTPRPAPILAVTKSDDRDPVGRGEPLVYTIGIENTGEATATAIVITDFYPEGFEFQEAEPPPTAGLNTWELPTLPPGESYEIVIGGTVSFSVPAGTVLVNEVTVTAAELPLIETTEETQVTETIPGRLRNNVRP